MLDILLDLDMFNHDGQLFVKAKIPISQRIRVRFQQLIINHFLDRSISFDEFLEGAKLAYTTIRQITSNVKDASQLKVLDGLVSPQQIQVA